MAKGGFIIECPYYISQNVRDSNIAGKGIRCEPIKNGGHFFIYGFPTEHEKREHKRKYCCSHPNWQNCKYARFIEFYKYSEGKK